MSPNVPLRSTCENPLMAFNGVRSSCDMWARNSDLWRLATSSSRLFSSSSTIASASSRVSLLHPLFQSSMRRLEPTGHLVEFVCEGAELVAAGTFDGVGRATRSQASSPRPGSPRWAVPDRVRAARSWRSPPGGTRPGAPRSARSPPGWVRTPRSGAPRRTPAIRAGPRSRMRSAPRSPAGRARS